MRNYIGVQFEFSKAMYDRNLQDELAKESTENINHTLRQRIASLEYNVHLLQYRERMLRSNCIGQDKAIKRLKKRLSTADKLQRDAAEYKRLCKIINDTNYSWAVVYSRILDGNFHDLSPRFGAIACMAGTVTAVCK